MPKKDDGKKMPDYESFDVDINGGLGLGKERSKNLLLASQMVTMREIFDKLDKYNEGLLKRSDLIRALRTDMRVVDFIDCEAVKKAYTNTIMTLDQVFFEIEKDERYEANNKTGGANTANSKQHIAWNEFLEYFNDYKEIEERNKKSAGQDMSDLKKGNQDKNTSVEEVDPAQELKTLMEQEKERRLQELPKLRPADQIDISERQLQLIKDIFDSIPRQGASKDTVSVLTFFMTIRKDPQIRAINSAVARDPEGYSRIPRETFQEVFDRMERE